MTTVLTDPKHLDRLIDRHQRLSDVRRVLAVEGGPVARREFAHLREGPWLSFSQQLGAMGHTLASRAADSLGWQLFDKEILHSIANHAGHRERVLTLQDERPMSRVDDYLKHLLVPGYATRPEYEIELFRVIASVGRRGLTVFVGRGVNWVLDSRYGMRVRVIAPRHVRVGRVAADEKISERDAERQVDDDDAVKRAFIRQVYHRDIDDPLGYDLMLNSGEFDLAAATEVVLTATRRKLERVEVAP